MGREEPKSSGLELRAVGEAGRVNSAEQVGSDTGRDDSGYDPYADVSSWFYEQMFPNGMSSK